MSAVKQIKLMTLAFPLRGDEVLLGMKKNGFGAGRWNGFGGKVMAGEAIEAATRRELLEEAGIEANDIEKRAVHTFEFRDDPVFLEVHTFAVSNFSGIPRESEEMRPAWFKKSALPFAEMWPDDYLWLPGFLEGKTSRNWFLFKDKDVLLDYRMESVRKFP